MNVQKIITLDQDEILSFCGQGDSKLRQMQSRMKATIVARGNEIRINGKQEEVDAASDLISELLKVHRTGKTELTEQHVQQAATHYEKIGKGRIHEVFLDTIPVPLKRKHVVPLTATQKAYIDAIRKNDVVFGVGPCRSIDPPNLGI